MARIDWYCHTCGEPTTNGAIHIDLQKVRAAGWSQRAQEALVLTYATIGGHITAEALRQS